MNKLGVYICTDCVHVFEDLGMCPMCNRGIGVREI